MWIHPNLNKFIIISGDGGNIIYPEESISNPMFLSPGQSNVRQHHGQSVRKWVGATTDGAELSEVGVKPNKSFSTEITWRRSVQV
jgi:hypothetical protein